MNDLAHDSSRARRGSAPATDDSACAQSAVEPCFAGTVRVDQCDPGVAKESFFASIVCGALGMFLPFFLWGASLSESDLLAIVSIVVGLVGAIAGAILPFAADRILHLSPETVSGNLRVCVDGNGVFVAGLGLMPWSEIRGLELVPDSNIHLIVNTVTHYSLLLTVPVNSTFERLFEALAFHLGTRTAAAAATEAAAAAAAEDSATVQRAVRFRPVPFKALILFGYALALAAFVFLLPGHRHEFADGEKFAGALLFPPLLAAIIWVPTIRSLRLLAKENTRVLRLDGGRLRSADGGLDCDLRRARVRRHHAAGIGYRFSYLGIRPENGRTWYFLEADTPNWRTFRDRLLAQTQDAAIDPPSGRPAASTADRPGNTEARRHD